MNTIIIRILGQFRNDRRSLLLLLVAPLLVLSLLYFILGDSGYVPKVATCNINDSLETVLQDKFDLVKTTEIPEMKSYLEENNLDAFLWSDENGIHIYMLDKNSKNSKVVKAIQGIKMAGVSVDYEYKSNEDNQLDSLSYVFLGMISFTFVFILSGMSFVRERTNQTLERMLMAPLQRLEVIGGYTLGYGMLSALQSVIIILFAVFVLHLHFEGSVFVCMLIMIAMSFAAVSVGSLLSIFANNELQLVQSIPVVLIPQIFFSGLIPLDTIPYGLGRLCYLTPAYYGCSTLQQVIVYGKGIGSIWVTLLELIAYICILFMLNVTDLKKYRKI